MAARLFRLRVALLGAIFRGSGGRAVRAIAGLLVAFAAAVGLAFVPNWLTGDAGERAIFDVLIGAALLAGCFVVPFFSNKRLLSAAQFAQFPAAWHSTAVGMLISSVVSWPFFVLVAWLVSLGVVRSEWQAAGWVAPVGLVLGALFAIVAVRAMSELSRLIAGERFQSALHTVGVVLLVALVPFAVLAISGLFGDSGAAAAAQAATITGFTPFGAPFDAIALAADGDTAAAAGRLGVALAGIVVLALVWCVLVKAAFERIDRPVDKGVARRGLGWFERFAAKPAQVIAARSLTYWSRDPRYRVALFAIPIAPIVMLLAFWVAGADMHWLSLVPLPVVLLLLAWSQHNDVAMDSTAIWEHVASGIRGWADRTGRLAPVMLIGVPLAVIGSSITVTISGEWRILPAVLGINLAVLFVAAGVTSVFSVAMPYPTTRPGDSPFVQPQWSGSGSGLAQTISMVVAIVMCVPPVWFGIVAMIDLSFGLNMGALIFGVLYGVAVLVAGVLVGGKLFERNGPELIEVTQVFD